MQQEPVSLFHSLAYSLLIAYCHPIQMVGVETIIMELHTLPVINSWYTLQQLSDAHVHFLVTCSSFISTPLYTRSFVHMCAYDASLIHTILVLLHVYICGFCRAVPGITACIQYCFLQCNCTTYQTSVRTALTVCLISLWMRSLSLVCGC